MGQGRRRYGWVLIGVALTPFAADLARSVVQGSDRLAARAPALTHRRAGAGGDDLGLRDVLAGQFEAVEEGGRNDDRGCVLVDGEVGDDVHRDVDHERRQEAQEAGDHARERQQRARERRVEDQPPAAGDHIRDIAPKLADLTRDVLFADVWERPQLKKRDRSLATVTALIAALAVPQIEGLQIALVHLLFNIAGILLFYPVPVMRKIPIRGAELLADVATRRKSVVAIYMVTVFVVVPAALILALGAGAPIVATRVGGIPEIVTEDVGGLVPPRDPVRLADSINDLAGDTMRRQNMSSAALRRFAERYDAAAWARRLVSLYRQVLDEQGHA